MNLYQENNITIHNRDCIEVMSEIEDEKFDLIIADPPYNIGDDNKRTKVGNVVMTNKEAWGEWDSFTQRDYDRFIFKVIRESYRILKKGGSFYMFSAREDNGYFIRYAMRKGFKYKNTLAILKQNPLPSFRMNNWRSAFELCMYLTKGKPKTFNFLSQEECVNVYPYLIGRKETDHPTEKPRGFIERIIQVSSNEGDIVFDPFLGSGTTMIAAINLGRKFEGCEKSEAYFNEILKRLKYSESKIKLF